MIIVTYTPPNKRPIYGIMLRRDAETGMIEVAFDQNEIRPFSIGWINVSKQIGHVALKSNQAVHWSHRALRLIESKNIEEARTVYAAEEAARKQERIRKEQAA